MGKKNIFTTAEIKLEPEEITKLREIQAQESSVEGGMNLKWGDVGFQPEQCNC